ncbi:lytic transglycosylase domain-containing protein [Dyadobacter sp. CY312]|uniref:lytic transglycosylase domain-containing protein n=1 Tax=Dyadobacter sp. CY312 TaxID=2907303 RepID=UPI001F1978C6|nr:lytic transglycosylase domain-containing protein [Dyadobacter sp. CY312]MCE7041199.1 LysM peptidoglycan-binding domain-containing protein [Dyadobacter sp. CY312]
MKISRRVLWLGAMCMGLCNVSQLANGAVFVLPQVAQADTVVGTEQLDSLFYNLPAIEEFSANPAVPEKLLRERFAKLEKSIPLTYHKSSHDFVEYFIYKKASFTKSMMEKMPLFFPLFEKTLQKHGLPAELKYLSMIESGLNPKVISHARAGGLWQFMPATGREFGLYQDSYIDERFEPVKATEAACRYLKQLYNIFGDWELALASYNTGPGNIKRAMRRSRGTTFWTIYNALPRETRSYVPQYVAMNYMMNYGNDHGIYAENPEYQIPNDTIHINGYIDLVAFCDNAGIDFQELGKLNPSITKNLLPDKTRDFVLRVPSVKYTYLVSNRSMIMDSCTRKLLPVNSMLAVADSTRNDSLGQNKAFPYAFASTGQNDEYEEEADEATPTTVKRTKRTSHTVRRGETLLSISKKYRVSVSQLKQWNRLRRSNIMRGQHLVIMKEVKEVVPSAAKIAVVAAAKPEKEYEKTRKLKMRYHTVQQGDTLWTISQRYGLPLDHLKKANKIRGNEIKPGQKLIISS